MDQSNGCHTGLIWGEDCNHKISQILLQWFSSDSYQADRYMSAKYARMHILYVWRYGDVMGDLQTTEGEQVSCSDVLLLWRRRHARKPEFHTPYVFRVVHYWSHRSMPQPFHSKASTASATYISRRSLSWHIHRSSLGGTGVDERWIKSNSQFFSRPSGMRELAFNRMKRAAFCKQTFCTFEVSECSMETARKKNGDAR